MEGFWVYGLFGRGAFGYTHNVCKTVCLSEELLVYAIRSGQSWAQFWTTIGPTVDLSKSASRTRKNVLKKQISCLGES
jgi:hypothetical protein